MKLLVTGSGGLIGSEAVDYFCQKGWEVFGIDNNERAQTFGIEGSTIRVSAGLAIKWLEQYSHFTIDIRDRQRVEELVRDLRPDLLIHTAAQPSHDVAGKDPLIAWDVNASGTVNLLEAMRQFAPEAVFVFLSSSKVYGDKVNEILMDEHETRYSPRISVYSRNFGIDETCSIDRSMHSLLGATKAAADLMVQEYGRYYGLKTVCLRCGCLTGANHQAVEQHGFLAYLVKCLVQRKPYTIQGYKGKQVRDNIHAYDVIRFIEQFYEAPRIGEVYNIGGGQANSCSILEASEQVINSIATFSKETKYYLYKAGVYPPNVSYIEEPRKGDHIWYVSDLTKAKTHYLGWTVTRDLAWILKELVAAQSKANCSA